ncbi:hypothetical protein BDZ91DRAFT_719889 [Kalaharituber pfeilii]|nr:hypothetical protein BDZ91DRAFT_719889 [Kalaharituber pfeilii]
MNRGILYSFFDFGITTMHLLNSEIPFMHHPFLQITLFAYSSGVQCLYLIAHAKRDTASSSMNFILAANFHFLMFFSLNLLCTL